MKKIIIIFLSLLLSFSAQANERFDGFNKWLFENGHTEYVSKVRVQYVRLSPSIAICGITINVTKLNIITI